MAILENTTHEALITGTSAADSISNSGYNVTIEAGAGNDSVWNDGGYYATINTGEGNDYVRNWIGDNVTINTGDGNDSVYNWSSESVTINTGEGNDSVYNRSSDSVSINTGDGNDSVYNWSSDSVSINTGAGDDSVYNWSSDSVSINTGAGNDSVRNWGGDSVTINTGDGNDSVYNSGSEVTINTGAGNDSVFNWDDSVTITGGKGNDSITNSGDNVSFKYTSGDGNDVIYGFKANSTLSIGGDSCSIKKSGDDIIVTVGKGKISLIGAASLSAVNIVGDETPTENNSWKLNGTTAKYGTSNKTLVTVSGVKSLNGLALNGKVVTVSKSALNAKKVTISNGYTLNLASDVDTPTTKNAGWTPNGTTAIYKSSSTTAGYTLADDGKSITYSKATAAKSLATIKGAKSTDNFSVSGKTINLGANSLNKKVTVNGSGYEFNFGSGYSNALITGGTKADIITANGKNISIKGGKGNDTLTSSGNGNVFVYANGDGKDVIKNFSESDTLSISGTAKVTTSGSDVIFTVGNGKITLKGANDKTITYIDKSGEHTYPQEDTEPYKMNAAKTAITLFSSFSDKTFDVTEYGAKIATIDASAVTQNIYIKGNEKASNIIGGAGDDSIEGNTKNDTLKGGAGADTFIYYDGDGNDVIVGYEQDDKIEIRDSTATIKRSRDNIVMTVGKSKGTITIKNADMTGITYYDEIGLHNAYNGSEVVVRSKNNAKVTVYKNYWQDTFKASDYGDGVVSVDASKVEQGMEIYGNTHASYIIGGNGNDTIYGSKDSDSLYGGNGNDVFVCSENSGDDLIIDYKTNDKIKIAKGSLSDSYTTKDTTLILAVGTSRISVQGGVDKTVTTIDEHGVESKKYYESKSNVAWFLEDDNNFSTDNELSNLIETKNYLPAAQIDTELNLIESLPVVTYSGKK